MIAETQYRIEAADLAVVLALARGGTLAGAAERLGVDASTVFRSLQRIERGLGASLFERTRAGYRATELGEALSAPGEQVEAALDAARAAAQGAPDHVAGTVRITSTDTVLHGLVAPALAGLAREQPALAFELHAGNELASLTRRDADVAVRATKRPPPHLVGQPLGTIEVALYAARGGPVKRLAQVQAGDVPWVAPDEGLPDHPSVLWRRRHFPRVVPRYRTHSVLTVAEGVAQGLGVGVLPMFLAEGRRDLRRLGEPIEEARTELWLLTHPDVRHLRRVAAVYGHLARAIRL